MKKLLWVIIAIVAVVGITFVFNQPSQQRPDGSPLQDSSSIESESGDAVVQSDYVKYSGEDGRTAFELLQETVQVDYDQYDFGVFVKSINNVSPQEGYFWKLYINGQDAQVGADQLQTSDADVIEWRMEQIDSL